MSYSLERWDAFVADALGAGRITIFDGFPLLDTVGLFVSGDPADDLLLWYARELQRRIAPLDPVLITLHQPDLPRALRRVLDLRGEGFERPLFNAHERYPLCAARGLSGFDCIIATWTRTRRIVEAVLPGFAAHELSIDVSQGAWDAYQGQILTYLGMDSYADGTDDLPDYVGAYGGAASLDVSLQAGRLLLERDGIVTPLRRWRGQTFYLEGIPATICFERRGGVIGGLTLDSAAHGGRPSILC